MRKDGAQQGDCEEGRSTTRKNALGWGPSINKIWAGNLGPVDLKLSNFCLNGLFKFKESHPVRNLILTSFTVWKSRNRRAITLEARWNPKCSRWKIANRKVFVTKHLVCDLEGTSERPSITRILRLTWCRRMTNRGQEPRPYRGEKPLIRSAVAFIWAAGRSGKTRRNKGKTYKRTSEGLEGTREGRRWGVGKSRRRSEEREEEEVMGGKRKRGKGGMSQQAYGILFSNHGLFARFCDKLTFNQTGGFDHSVFDTSVQLTEARSARDQPKQPPAKKKGDDAGIHEGFRPPPVHEERFLRFFFQWERPVCCPRMPEAVPVNLVLCER